MDQIGSPPSELDANGLSKDASVEHLPTIVPIVSQNEKINYDPNCLITNRRLRTSFYHHQYAQKHRQQMQILPNLSLNNQQKIKHDETIRKYDHLLQKMRLLDEELKSLSTLYINERSRKNSLNEKY